MQQQQVFPLLLLIFLCPAYDADALVPSNDVRHRRCTDCYASIPTPCFTLMHARPKSKWDDLTDDEDDVDDTAACTISQNIPPDMTYTERNIRRQANTFDQLESIGGPIHDVYARAPGEKEWWLVGKIARVSGE